MSKKLVAVASVSLLGLLAACSSADDELIPVGPSTPENGGTYKFAEGTMQADASFARDVVVEAERLLLPLSYEGYARSLPLETVLWGDRAPNAASNNPMGFLRRVKGVTVEGQNVVIATGEADLNELFAEADLRMGGEPNYAMPITMPGDIGELGPPVEAPTGEPDEPPGEETDVVDEEEDVAPLGSGVELLDYAGSSTGSMAFNVPFRFDSSKLRVSGTAGISGSAQWSGLLSRSFRASPRVSLTYRSRGLTVYQNIEVGLSFPWSQTDTACSVVEGEISRSASNILLGRDATKITVFSRNLPAPPLGPIPTTIRGELKFSCAPFVGGKASVRTSTTTSGRATVDFGLDRGGNFFHRASSVQDPQRTPQRNWNVEGSGGVKCKVEARIGFYLAGVFGGFAQYSPSVEARLSGTGAFQTGKPPQGDSCLDVKLAHAVDVGVSVGVGRFKFEPTATVWKRERSLLHSCTSDGCSGRADGWYCDGDTPGGSKQCRGGSVAGGSSCVSGQYCQISNAQTRAARLDASGTPACGTTRPPSSSLAPTCN